MKSQREERYARNAHRRRSDIERSLMGETLEAFHKRETAKPPTLREIYQANHKSAERCLMTDDLFDSSPKGGK